MEMFSKWLALCSKTQPVICRFPHKGAMIWNFVSFFVVGLGAHEILLFFVEPSSVAIDQFHKSQNAPVPYPTILHSEQKCAHFCSEWSIVRYGTGAFWDLWIRSIYISKCCNISQTLVWYCQIYHLINKTLSKIMNFQNHYVRNMLNL